MVSKRGKIRILQYLGAGLLALFSLLYALPELGMSGNESSRFATVQAVAEQHTFAIERTDFRTVDRIFYRGHLYSDKPLFQAWAVGTVLRPLLAVTNWNFRENRKLLVYLVNAVSGGVVNILLFWWLFNMLRRVRRGAEELKFLLAFGSVAGSWILSYSVVLNNHTPAALCVLGAYVAVWKYSRKPTWRAALLGALACGVLGALDIPGGVIFGLALIPALALSAPADKRVEHLLAAACVVALAALGVFTLNRCAYGHPLPLYLVQGGTFRPGVSGKSPFGYPAECLFTCRGIFSYQPFLLLVFPALWYCRRRLRAAEYCAVAATAVFTVFYIVVTNEFGGAAYGFRYLIPVIPVWSFLAGRFVLEFSKGGARIAMGALAAVLIVWGVVTAAAGAYFPFCFAFEGGRTPEGHFSRSVRSTFGGNVLCWSCEHFPESALTRALFRHYGERPALEHLFWSYINMKKLDIREIGKFYRARGVPLGRLGTLSDGELRAWIRLARERGVEKHADK